MALVCTEAESEPASGSVNARNIVSPEANEVNSSLCSYVPSITRPCDPMPLVVPR